MAIRFEDTEDRNSRIFLAALSETVLTLSQIPSDSFLSLLAQQIPKTFEAVQEEEEARGEKFPLGEDDLATVQQMRARLAAEFRRIQNQGSQGS